MWGDMGKEGEGARMWPQVTRKERWEEEGWIILVKGRDNAEKRREEGTPSREKEEAVGGSLLDS